MNKVKRFTLTDEHLCLLRRMYVRWWDAEYGAPCIDPKRPYGNSNVEEDIAEILGWELFQDAGGELHLTSEQRERAVDLHEDTKVALQVVLSIGGFDVGAYECAEYGRDWHKAGAA